MAEEQKVAPVVDSTVAPSPAVVDSTAKQPGTPVVAVVDSAGTPKVISEADFKQAIADRDAAKAAVKAATENAEKAFFASDAGKAVLAIQAKAAAAEAAAVKAAEAEALARGEHLKVIAARDADIVTLKATHEATVKSYRDNACRQAFDAAVRAVGVLDVTDTQGLLQQALADGTVSVNEKGEVVGVHALVRKATEAKPHWFRSGATEALKRIETAAPGLVQASLSTLDTREQPPDASEPTSLAKPSRLSRQMASGTPQPKR